MERARRFFLATVAACVAVAPVRAQQLPTAAPSTAGDTLRLTLAEARQRARVANPELVAARLDTAVARGELRQAGVLAFNPSADVLAAGGGNGAEPGVSQELEVFGQRGARRAAGRAGLARSVAEVANVTRLTIGATDRGFYRLVSSTQRRALADEVLALNARLADVARRQLAAGEISRLDYNLAVVEYGRSRARALAARRENEQESAEFARLLNLPRGTVVQPVLTPADHPPADSGRVAPAARLDSAARPDTARAPDAARVLVDVDSLTALALARRPDLVAIEARRQQAGAQVALARREALPNLLLRATSEQSAGSGRVLRPGVGITLPLFNRNQGEVQARRALEAQARLEQAALVTRVRAEIASAVTAYRTASEAVEVLESTVLGPARQNRQLLEIAYREGKVGLPVLLLIRNQVIDAELDYWDAWLAQREATATLAEATGEHVTSVGEGAR